MYVVSVVSYPQEKEKFDEILSAIEQYFDLFKKNEKLLEDLWI